MTLRFASDKSARTRDKLAMTMTFSSLLTLFTGLLLIAAIGVVALWGVIRAETRASQMLEAWLRQNEFRLLEKSTPWVKDNPFFASSNRGQKVFKVVIATPDGQTRRAWVRCGHALAGTAIDQIEVKWDETAPASGDGAGDEVSPAP